jgi:hypothetical protein
VARGDIIVQFLGSIGEDSTTFWLVCFVSLPGKAGAVVLGLFSHLLTPLLLRQPPFPNSAGQKVHLLPLGILDRALKSAPLLPHRGVCFLREETRQGVSHA